MEILLSFTNRLTQFLAGDSTIDGYDIAAGVPREIIVFGD